MKIYRYDVNSLYPYVMKHFSMPVGNPIYFEGDISLIDSKAFGFFQVEVQSPKELKNPILQTTLGLSTISPLATWTGIYSSEEIYNAMKYGYSFKIINGYLFDKAYIFTQYVDELYQMKKDTPKNSATYIIAKLLLNALYGRFGMRPDVMDHAIINNKTLHPYLTEEVSNVISLTHNK